MERKNPSVLHRISSGIILGFSFGFHMLAIMVRGLGSIISFIHEIALLPIIRPVYFIIILLRVRLIKWVSSARGWIFFLVASKYTLHAIIAFFVLLVVFHQRTMRTASASEMGRKTLLYTWVTDKTDDYTEIGPLEIMVAERTSHLADDTVSFFQGYDDDSPDMSELLVEETIPGSIAVTPDTGDEEPSSRSTTESYVVRDGDTVATIARRFQVDVSTIVAVNGLGTKAFIKPGMTLKIPAGSGLLHLVKKGDTLEAIAKKYNVSAEAIATANHVTSNASLVLGDELLIPGAKQQTTPVKKPSVAVRPNVPISKIRGKEYDAYQELTKQDTRIKPEDAKVDDTQVARPQSKLFWPTRQRLINQYYGWRHTGVDINGDYTDPIYASDDGVVEKAGWNNGGYGLMVLIDHQNGLKTRYGHASKLFVNAGDTVKRGQVIAMVGTTGRSTGTHLHYEVYINGKRTNPLSYTR